MACVVTPKIKNKEGELVDSELFKQLLAISKNRSMAKKIFAAINSEKFKKDWGDKLNYTSIGEFELDSLLLNIDLKIPLETIQNYFFQDYGDTVFPSTQEGKTKSFQKALQYNKESKFAEKYPAHVKFDGKTYTLVIDKQPFNDTEYKDYITESFLSKKIKDYLDSVRFASDSVDSYLDILKLKNNSGREAGDFLAQEIATLHNFLLNNGSNIPSVNTLEFILIGMNNSPLIQRFLQNLENTAVFEKYLDLNDSIISTLPDNYLAIKTGAQLLQNVMLGIDIENEAHRNFATRILGYLRDQFSHANLDTLHQARTSAQSLYMGDMETSKRKDSPAPIDMNDIRYSVVSSADLATDASISAQAKANKLVEDISKLLDKATEIAEVKVLDPSRYKELRTSLSLGLAIGNTLGAISGFMQAVSEEYTHISESFNLIDDPNTSEFTRINALRNIRDFLKAVEISIRPLSEYVNNLPSIDPSSNLFEEYQKIKSSFTVLTASYHTIKVAYKDRAKQFYFDYLSNFVDESALYDPIHKRTRTKEDLLFGELEEGNRCLTDIHSIDRYMDAARDSGVDIIRLFDQASKRAKNKARMNTIKHQKEIQNLQTKLESKGLGNTKWMFKTDSDGKYTGYYVTPWSWTAYKKAIESTDPETEAKIKRLKAQKKLFIFDSFSEQNVPNPEYFPHPQYSKLTSAQKEAYNEIMAHKKRLEERLPLARRNVYRAVGIRNSAYQRILKNGITNIPSQIKEALKDAVGFREGEDLDSRASIIDFDNKKIMELPYLYQHLSESVKADLCTDVLGTMSAYAAMVYNVNATNEVAGALELCLNTITDSIPIKKVREKAEAARTGRDSNIVKRLEDFMDMQVYERYLKDEGQIGKLNVAKTTNTIIGLTALNQYALNLCSGIANVTVGNIAQKIESFSGQHYTEADTLWADKTYGANILAYMANIGKRVKKDKLSLWEEHFNTLQEYDPRNQQVHNYLKTRVGQKFGQEILYTISNAGEHWMAHRNMLALAHKRKVLYRGAEISLWDAYEVVPADPNTPNGAHILKLKEGVTKLDGTHFTNNDEYKFMRAAAAIAQEMHGIYNNEDKSAVQKLAVGRLAMLFRKWVMPTINKRYKKEIYNYDLGKWQEGYYRTCWRISKQIIKELREHQTGIMTQWKNLEDFEKANIKRALVELGTFGGVLLGIAILSGLKDDDDDRWFINMLLLQMYRLKTEIGAFTPTPLILQESLRIIKSPTAAVNTMQDLIDLFQLLDASNYETFAGEEAIIQKGRWKDYSKAEKLIIKSPLFPTVKTVSKAFSPEDILPFYTSGLF